MIMVVVVVVVVVRGSGGEDGRGVREPWKRWAWRRDNVREILYELRPMQNPDPLFDGFYPPQHTKKRSFVVVVLSCFVCLSALLCD